MDLNHAAEVGIEEMLAARERRVNMQAALSAQYSVPIISFTLNIPGPVKVFGRIPEVFEEGCSQIRDSLKDAGIPLLQEYGNRERTGYEAFFCADSDAGTLKHKMTALEEGSRFGRLYDIDVIQTDGIKVSREEIGLPPRTCLLCERPAHECGRSRRHSVDELVAYIRELTDGFGTEYHPDKE